VSAGWQAPHLFNWFDWFNWFDLFNQFALSQPIQPMKQIKQISCQKQNQMVHAFSFFRTRREAVSGKNQKREVPLLDSSTGRLIDGKEDMIDGL
jgi:hypothetical protein